MKRSLLFICFCFITLLGLQAQEASHLSSKWRIGASFGAGYSLASTKDAIQSLEDMGVNRKNAKDGVNGLKWQLHLGGDVHYLFKPTMGVGLKYLHSQSDSQIKDVALNMNGDGITIVNGNIDTQYYVNFIGPSFFSRSVFGKENKFALTGITSIGYSHLRMEQVTLYSPVVGTSSSVGLFAALGIEYYIMKRMALGCDLGIFGSSFKKINLDDGYNTLKVDLGDAPENVTSLNLTFHIRFYL